MSELSDLLRELFTAEETKKEQEGTVTLTSSLEDNVPQMTPFQDYYTEKVITLVRKYYRKNIGAADFPDPLTAFNTVLTKLEPEALALSLEALSDGVQMGQASSLPYKKYKMFDQLEKVFTAKGWREESALISLTFEADPDALEVLTEYFADGCHFLAAGSGYGRGLHQPDKIWDLCGVAICSSLIGAYIIGNQLGAKWKEQSVLDGILAVSTTPEEES